MFSDESIIAIGGAFGKFALTIRDSFNRGRSSSCITFNNEPLASSEDFNVKYFEVWAFENY